MDDALDGLSLLSPNLLPACWKKQNSIFDLQQVEGLQCYMSPRKAKEEKSFLFMCAYHLKKKNHNPKSREFSRL